MSSGLNPAVGKHRLDAVRRRVAHRPDRRRILADPPDVLLATPESLESMLVSRRVDHRSRRTSLSPKV